MHMLLWNKPSAMKKYNFISIYFFNIKLEAIWGVSLSQDLIFLSFIILLSGKTSSSPLLWSEQENDEVGEDKPRGRFVISYKLQEQVKHFLGH